MLIALGMFRFWNTIIQEKEDQRLIRNYIIIFCALTRAEDKTAHQNPAHSPHVPFDYLCTVTANISILVLLYLKSESVSGTLSQSYAKYLHNASFAEFSILQQYHWYEFINTIRK